MPHQKHSARATAKVLQFYDSRSRSFKGLARFKLRSDFVCYDRLGTHFHRPPQIVNIVDIFTVRSSRGH